MTPLVDRKWFAEARGLISYIVSLLLRKQNRIWRIRNLLKDLTANWTDYKQRAEPVEQLSYQPFKALISSLPLILEFNQDHLCQDPRKKVNLNCWSVRKRFLCCCLDDDTLSLWRDRSMNCNQDLICQRIAFSTKLLHEAHLLHLAMKRKSASLPDSTDFRSHHSYRTIMPLFGFGEKRGLANSPRWYNSIEAVLDWGKYVVKWRRTIGSTVEVYEPRVLLLRPPLWQTPRAKQKPCQHRRKGYILDAGGR